MENPNIDPRVAPHALSFTSSIDFFFAVSSVSLTTLKLYMKQLFHSRLLDVRW